MSDKFQILFLIFSVALLFGVFELARTRRVRGKYTVVWLATSLSFVALATFPGLLYQISDLLGVYRPANAIFIVAIVFILLLLVEFSAIMTSQHRKNRDLIKKVSLLTWRVEELERKQDETFSKPALGA